VNCIHGHVSDGWAVLNDWRVPVPEALHGEDKVVGYIRPHDLTLRPGEVGANATIRGVVRVGPLVRLEVVHNAGTILEAEVSAKELADGLAPGQRVSVARGEIRVFRAEGERDIRTERMSR